MPSNRDVADFYELRAGFQGMTEFASAALRFLDHHGIGIAAKKRLGRPVGNGNSNGNGAAPKHFAALRAAVKHKYATTRPLSSSEKTRQKRAASAALLESLDRVKPRQPTGGSLRIIGSLVRRGYAKKKGDGYIRTAKPFVVPTARAASATTTPDTTGAITVNEAAKRLNVSDSHVRTLIRTKRLRSHTETRSRPGRGALPIMVIDRDELTRFTAQLAAEAAQLAAEAGAEG